MWEVARGPLPSPGLELKVGGDIGAGAEISETLLSVHAAEGSDAEADRPR